MYRLNRCRIPSELRLLARLSGMLAAAALMTSIAGYGFVALSGHTREADLRTTPDLSSIVSPVCDLRHPIGVRVVPVGAPVRGQAFRAEVVIDPEVDLSNVQVDLISPGRGQAIGRTHAALDGVQKGRPESSEFAVRLPTQGRRFLLQFRVQAEGPNGALSRVATYNVLPDGPADPGKVITTPEGATIREYAARRIEQ
jgi:hypothetical protein